MARLQWWERRRLHCLDQPVFLLLTTLHSDESGIFLSSKSNPIQIKVHFTRYLFGNHFKWAMITIEAICNELNPKRKKAVLAWLHGLYKKRENVTKEQNNKRQ